MYVCKWRVTFVFFCDQYLCTTHWDILKAVFVCILSKHRPLSSTGPPQAEHILGWLQTFPKTLSLQSLHETIETAYRNCTTVTCLFLLFNKILSYRNCIFSIFGQLLKVFFRKKKFKNSWSMTYFDFLSFSIVSGLFFLQDMKEKAASIDMILDL